MRSSLEFLFYIGLHLFTADVSGLITEDPLNAVTEVGQQAIFNCTSDTTLQNWIFSAKRDDLGTPSAQSIAINCVVQSGFTTQYDVDRPGGSNNKCNLIVKAATMQQAGVYTCSDTAAGPSAILTVIDSSPVITANNTSDAITVVENESVIVECVLNHNGCVAPAPTLRPYFFWTDFNGQNVSSSYDSTTANTAVSQITVTAGRQNITPYTCHVYIQLTPPTTPNYAGNIPTVSSSASSTIVDVFYGPSKPYSTSRPDVISINGVPCGISVLTCSSTGNPAPSYRWYDSAENIVLSTTNTLDLAEVNMNFMCEAYNIIRNVLYSESTTYIVSKDNCTSTVDCCVYPHDETTSVTVKGCDNGTLCDCSQGSSGIVLTCSANTFPNASYMWTGPNGQVTSGQVFNKVTANGTHRCTAYFDRESSNYTGNVIFPNGTNEATVDRCYNAAATTISTIPTATATTARATTVSTQTTNNNVAIAIGVLFGISLVFQIC